MVMAPNRLGGLGGINWKPSVGANSPLIPGGAPAGRIPLGQDVNVTRGGKIGRGQDIDLGSLQIPGADVDAATSELMNEATTAGWNISMAIDATKRDLQSVATAAAGTSDTGGLMRLQQDAQDDAGRLHTLEHMRTTFNSVNAVLAATQPGDDSRAAAVIANLSALSEQVGQTMDDGTLQQLSTRMEQGLNDLRHLDTAVGNPLLAQERNARQGMDNARANVMGDMKALVNMASQTTDQGQLMKIQADIASDKQKLASLDKMRQSFSAVDAALAGSSGADPRLGGLVSQLSMLANQAAGTRDNGALEKLATQTEQTTNDLKGVPLSGQATNMLYVQRNGRAGLDAAHAAVEADMKGLANQAASTTDQGQLMKIQADLDADQRKLAQLDQMGQIMGQADRLVTSGHVPSSQGANQLSVQLAGLAAQAANTQDFGTLQKITTMMKQSVNDLGHVGMPVNKNMLAIERNARQGLDAHRVNFLTDMAAMASAASQTNDQGALLKLQNDIDGDKAAYNTLGKMQGTFDQLDRILAGTTTSNPRATALMQDVAKLANAAAQTNDNGTLVQIQQRLEQDLNDLRNLNAPTYRPVLDAARQVRSQLANAAQGVALDRSSLAAEAAQTQDQGQLMKLQNDMDGDREKQGVYSEMDQTMGAMDALLAGKSRLTYDAQTVANDLMTLASKAANTHDMGALSTINAKMSQDLAQLKTLLA